jgi:hypothetical protein
MHKEMEKIQVKKRLASQRLKLEEMVECTFTPKLVTKASKIASNEPMNVDQLSLRLYAYADKFKTKRKHMRSMLEIERGGEIRFTPHLETSKMNNQLEVVKERKDVYENLYEDSKRRTDTKSKLKKSFGSGIPPVLDNDDLFLTVSKPPSYKKTKNRSVYKSLGAKLKKRKAVKFLNADSDSNNTKSYSSSIYLSSRKHTIA